MRNLGVWQAVAIASQIGFVFAAAVGIGIFAGSYLDSLLRTSPVFTLLGALAGIASGVYSSVQMVRFITRNGRS